MKLKGVGARVRPVMWMRAVTVAAFALGTLCMAGQSLSAEPTPVISTVAGGGSPTGNGDGGPATAAKLDNVQQIAVDAAGNLYLAETYAFRVRKVSANGIISTLAGNGTQTYNGDNIPATSAGIDVRGVAVDASGNVYIADGSNGRIRKVGANGLITTLASRVNPTALAVSPSGVVHYLSAGQVWKIASNGPPQLVAGTGVYGFSGDSGPATAAQLANPSGLAFDPTGTLYIADNGNGRIRRVSTTGVVTTVAGGGPFRSDPVVLNTKINPQSVAADARGNVYILETGNMVRIVSGQGITRVAVGRFNDTTFGNVGAPWGFGGDGGPALDALLNQPVNLALDAQGNLFIADTGNARIRKVTPIPTPITPAGLNAFSPYTSTLVGSFTQHVAIADVTGDGRDDALLTTTTWSGPYAEPDNDFRLLLFVQQPDGTLAAPRKYLYYGDPAGRSGSGLVTADLNKDGYADVIVGTLRGITIYLGNASGLSTGIEYAAVANAEVTTQLAIMDADRDGNPDIIARSGGRTEGGSSPYDLSGLVLYYGNGQGGIKSRRFVPRPDDLGWKGLRAADVNLDGAPELLSTWSGFQSGYVGGLEITPLDGAGGFLSTTRRKVSTNGGWGAAQAVGDFNGDGRPDAVVSVSGNAPNAAYALFRQNADGQFTEAREWKAFDVPDEMLGADINGDRRDDLLVIHGGWSSIGYQPQTQQGLGEEIKYYVPQSGNPHLPALAVGDLNGDGCKDVAMADYNYGLVILRGRNCTPPRAVHGAQPLVPPRQNPVLSVTTQATAQPPSSVAAVTDSNDSNDSKDSAPTPRASNAKAISPPFWVVALLGWLSHPIPMLATLLGLLGLGWITLTRVR